MRVMLVVIVAVGVAGCSGGSKAGVRRAVIARTIPRMVKRFTGDRQAPPAAEPPTVVVTGNLSPDRR